MHVTVCGTILSPRPSSSPSTQSHHPVAYPVTLPGKRRGQRSSLSGLGHRQRRSTETPPPLSAPVTRGPGWLCPQKEKWGLKGMPKPRSGWDEEDACYGADKHRHAEAGLEGTHEPKDGLKGMPKPSSGWAVAMQQALQKPPRLCDDAWEQLGMLISEEENVNAAAFLGVCSLLATCELEYNGLVF
eukprot:1149633-Pelagomonas_calceolata.AAC.1